MIVTESDKMIVRIALQILRHEEDPTTEKIRNIVLKVIEMLRDINQFEEMENVAEERLVKEIETLCDIYTPPISNFDKHS